MFAGVSCSSPRGSRDVVIMANRRRFYLADKLVYMCRRGLVPLSEPVITCTSTGHWDKLPRCKGPTLTLSSYLIIAILSQPLYMSRLRRCTSTFYFTSLTVFNSDSSTSDSDFRYLFYQPIFPEIFFHICELSFNRDFAPCWRAFDMSNKYY